MNTPDLTPTLQSSLMDELRLSCRKLFLRRHEVQAHIGAHDFEKGVTQRLWIDVELWVPFERSTPSLDSLHEVVDYDFVRLTIKHRIEQGHIHLQETLVDDLARALLAHPAVRAVRVASEKPDVYPDVDAIGIEVFHFKSP